MDDCDNTNQQQRQQQQQFDLASFLSSKERRQSAAEWQKICPKLSITTTVNLSDVRAEDDGSTAEINPEAQTELEKRKERLINNGYALVDDAFDVKLVREGIESLHRQKIPATFIMIFDEAWQLARKSKWVLEKASHKKNEFNYDVLAWYVPNGSSGFSPHRDRQPDDAPSSFHADQQAKFITQWIALSDATPQNSCLYMIPKSCDPGYTEGDIISYEETESINDNPLNRALRSKESFQHIRCLPRAAGQSILFTHRIIHWGSQGDADDPGSSKIFPRIAISFVCSDPDFEAPLLVNHKMYFSDIRMPPLHIRLLLVCAQLLIYYQRFDLSKAVIKVCYDYCKQHEEELEENYRRKLLVEFVNAMKEQTARDTITNNNCIVTTDLAINASGEVQNTKSGTQEESRSNGADEDDYDDEEAMMEEMLNAEVGGYGEFEDDYDNIEDEDGLQEKVKFDPDDQQIGEEAIDDFDLFGKRKKEEKHETNLQAKKAKTVSDSSS